MVLSIPASNKAALGMSKLAIINGKLADPAAQDVSNGAKATG
jgi:hypothetical protein